MVALCTLASAAARKEGADAVRQALQEALDIVAGVCDGAERATPAPPHGLNGSRVKFEASGAEGSGVEGGEDAPVTPSRRRRKADKKLLAASPAGTGEEGGGGKGDKAERGKVSKVGGEGEGEAVLVKASNAVVVSPSSPAEGRQEKMGVGWVESGGGEEDGGNKKKGEVRKTDKMDRQTEEEEEENAQNALALWLAAVRAGKLKLGDKVPATWREGLHYVRSGKHVFSCGETVIAIRSNGDRTIATIDEVKEGGAVELIVGEGLQKVVRSSAVGKLASALDEFVRDSMRGSRSGGKRGINAAKLPAASLGPPKCLASLSDSDFWKKGLGVDGQLLARLRDLEIKEVSGESGPGGEEWGRGDGEDWI